MIILGLDASSTCTGWSIIECSSSDNIKLVDFGEIQLTKFKKKPFPLEYLLVLYTAIGLIIKKYKPDKVYIEDIFQRNVKTFKSLARIRGVCEISCIVHGIKNITELNALIIRKAVLGEATLEKIDICSIIEKKFNTKLATVGYDQADAVLVALGGVKETYEPNTLIPLTKRRRRKIKSNNASSPKIRRKRSVRVCRQRRRN
jgi:crossover junction endodeoxyribonuclease RuvC